MNERLTLADVATTIRLTIRQEVQDGAKVQMYESVSRTIFTLEADGEIHVLGEVKHGAGK
jgi:hypothetical protein